MEFTDYPQSPLHVRIIEPRLEFLTGGVTFGGTLALSVLSPEGWTPETTPLDVLRMVRDTLILKGAGLDTRNFASVRKVGRAMRYTQQEALAALNRHARIDRKLQPTRAGFEQQFVARSTRCARETLGVDDIPVSREFGNRIYLPQSAFEDLMRADRELAFPIFFALTSQSCTTHVSSVSFTAPEGVLFVPEAVMQCNGIAEGSVVTLRCVHLPTAKAVTLQLHTRVSMRSRTLRAYCGTR